VIQYLPRDATRNEETLEKLRDMATSGSWPMDPAKRVEQAALSIATAMSTIHGGQWRVQIDHLAGLVVVVRH
jgi:hypothetical protein